MILYISSLLDYRSVTCLKSKLMLLSDNSSLIFIIKSLSTKGGLHFLVYLLVRPIHYHCTLCTICRPMLLICVILVLLFRYAFFLLIHVLLKEYFLLHQCYIRPCMLCLVPRVSTSNKV